MMKGWWEIERKKARKKAEIREAGRGRQVQGKDEGEGDGTG